MNNRRKRTPYKPKRIPWFMMATPMPKEQEQRNEIMELLSWKAVELGTATDKDVIHVMGVIAFAECALHRLNEGETLEETVGQGRRAIAEILRRVRGGLPVLNSDIVTARKAFDIGMAALQEFDRREVDEILCEDLKRRGQEDVYLGIHRSAMRGGL